MTPLPEIGLAKPAIIVSITGSDHLTQRLYELGLIEGDPIEIIGVAPLGDPLEIQVRHGVLSLRKSEAARILVEVQA
ncbi:MAG TPA: ferrous iron transport protein A [Gemmatales bacterium]|nr:ferrous iron transport protein A [Gemmatales bacterium]